MEEYKQLLKKYHNDNFKIGTKPQYIYKIHNDGKITWKIVTSNWEGSEFIQDWDIDCYSPIDASIFPLQNENGDQGWANVSSSIDATILRDAMIDLHIKLLETQ